MAKFHGKIGFAVLMETAPGVWMENITERYYFGDLLRSSRRLQPTDRVNDDVNISNEISILADAFANDNVNAMRYAIFAGSKWKITDVEILYPRLKLTLGGIYNG